MFSHYTEPRMPETISLDKFEGLMLHSHDYRDPERFKDRRVLVLGAGPSGTDIVTEIAPFVGKVTSLFPVLYIPLLRCLLHCVVVVTVHRVKVCMFHMSVCLYVCLAVAT